MEHYDLNAQYDAEVKPLVLQMMAIAERYQMPLLVCCGGSNDATRAGSVCSLATYPHRTPERLLLAALVLKQPTIGVGILPRVEAPIGVPPPAGRPATN